MIARRAQVATEAGSERLAGRKDGVFDTVWCRNRLDFGLSVRLAVPFLLEVRACLRKGGGERGVVEVGGRRRLDDRWRKRRCDRGSVVGQVVDLSVGGGGKRVVAREIAVEGTRVRTAADPEVVGGGSIRFTRDEHSKGEETTRGVV